MNRKLTLCTTILFTFIIFPLFFTSCKAEVDNRFYLDNFWQWDIGDDDGTAPASIVTGQGLKKLAIDQEKNFANLFDDKTGYVWLRADFTLPEYLKNKDLGIFVGTIKMASQIYVNGKTVGTAGVFPPKEFTSGTSVHGYSIPYGYINQDGENTVIIKIWTNTVGSISSRVFIGESKEVILFAEEENYNVSKLNHSFSAAMILIGVFYFFMYLSRKKAKEHLMFSLLNITSAFYIVPFYIGEVPWFNSDVISYLTFAKVFSGLFLHITIWFVTSFEFYFIQKKESKKSYIFRLVLLAISCILVLLPRTYRGFSAILPITCVFSGIQVLISTHAVLKGFINKERDVYIIFIGFVPILIMLVVDFVIHVILKNTTQPFYTIFGWQCSIIAFLLILAVRYGKIYAEFERLNGKLEAEVEQRTIELIMANKNLQREQDIAQRDMDMAVHIQKCFYPDLNQQYIGWDIAAYFQPQSGVSGDLYDFYEKGEKLEGVSIFDVSGHGISAGLVTMLSKHIIRREYLKGIAQRKDLSTIMEEINKSVITGKGNIENYLTGLVINLGTSYQKDKCKCQLVNAGHPYPLMYSVAKHEVIELVSQTEHSVGSIGMSGIDVNFPRLDFVMDNQDVLVLFTDGVNEYENKSGEQYGKKHLAEVLKTMGTSSAKRILNAILSDINTFSQGVPQQDDITILVIKRNKDVDYIPEL